MEKKGTLRQKRRPKGDPNPQKGPLGDPGPLKGTHVGTVVICEQPLTTGVESPDTGQQITISPLNIKGVDFLLGARKLPGKEAPFSLHCTGHPLPSVLQTTVAFDL